MGGGGGRVAEPVGVSGEVVVGADHAVLLLAVRLGAT